MGKFVDELIEQKISEDLVAFAPTETCTDEDIEHVKVLLREDYHAKIKEEIEQEITEEEINIRKRKIADFEQSTKVKRAVKAAKRFIIEGIIVAFVIGLFVNQVTELFGYLKAIFENKTAVWVTVLGVVILFALIFGYILYRLTDAITEATNSGE